MKHAILLVAVAALGACDTNDPLALSITRFELVTPLQQCVASPSITTDIARGLLDVGLVSTFNQGYVAVPVIQNNLPSSTQGAATGIEMNAVQVSGFDVQLEPQPPLTLPANKASYYVPAAGGRVPPGGTQQIAVGVEIVPASIATVLATNMPMSGTSAPLLLVRMRAVGSRSESTIVGDWVVYPIDLCTNCLNVDHGPCPLPATPAPRGGCFPQQDQVSDCCTPVNGPKLCGAAAPTM
jgi:hypothetical protein